MADGRVQINLRCSEEQLALIDAARGSVPRNRWMVEAVVRRVEALAAADGRSAPSVRAPRGCRVVGVPAALRESPRLSEVS